MAESTAELPEDYDDLPEGELLGSEELSEKDQVFLAQVLRDKTWALSDAGYIVRNEEFERMFSWYVKQHYQDEAELDPSDVESVMDESTSDTEHRTILPIPTNIINSVHGILTDEDFIISCLSSNPRRSNEAAVKTERFCHGVYWINRQLNGGDPWEDAAMDMLIYGWGCIYSYWDEERAALARRKGRARDALDMWAMPIRVERRNPRDIYPLPYGVRERWRGVMWIVNRSVREIEDEWNVVLEPPPLVDENGEYIYDAEGNLMRAMLDDETLVEYVDYWSWEKEEDGDWCIYHCVVANDQLVKPPTRMPHYELLPYEIFFCRRTPSNAGSKLGLSFLFPVIEPVQEMEYLANRMSELIDMYADPMLHVEGRSGGNDTPIEKGPGAVIETDVGGSARYITWEGSPPDISRLMTLWREAAQDAFPPVMTGLQGGTSGLDTIALQQGGKLQTNKPRRNLELAIQRVNTKIIRLLQKFSWDEPVYVVGIRQEGDEEQPFEFTIKGKETRGFENTKVTIRGRFPREELQNATLASQVVGAGLMSRREAAGKYLYLQDPQKSFDMWMQEQTWLDPTWRQFFFSMYMSLPAQSDVTRALSGEDEEQEELATDLAGGDIAAALAETVGQVQQGVQRTPIESNAFSRLAGGAPSDNP